MPTTE
jgi:hypothetical protein